MVISKAKPKENFASVEPLKNVSRFLKFCDLQKVFEDQNEAARYCDLLQGGGQGCEGVAEIEASSVRNSIPSRVDSTFYIFSMLKP